MLVHTYPENSEESKEMKDAFLKLIEVYKENFKNNNLNVLMAGMEVWQVFLQRNKAHYVKAMDFVNICYNFFFSKHPYPRIFITVPLLTSTEEHSFSTLLRIKKYLRNTMCEGRLNGLPYVNIHKEIPVDIKYYP